MSCRQLLKRCLRECTQVLIDSTHVVAEPPVCITLQLRVLFSCTVLLIPMHFCKSPCTMFLLLAEKPSLFLKQDLLWPLTSKEVQLCMTMTGYSHGTDYIQSHNYTSRLYSQRRCGFQADFDWLQVRLWDIRTYNCLQVFDEHMTQKPKPSRAESAGSRCADM